MNEHLTCVTCVFLRHSKPPADVPEDGADDLLTCVRYPPNSRFADTAACWPTMKPDDWCGEYQTL